MGTFIINLKIENIYIYNMVTKKELITKFSQYLDKHNHDNSKFDTINSILSVLDKLIIKFEKDKKRKQNDIESINFIVNDFFKKNLNKFWFKKQYKEYYIYDGVRFTKISCDKILYTVAREIPYEYFRYKYNIQKTILNRIIKNPLFQLKTQRIFKLEKKSYKYVKTLLSHFFNNEKSVIYIMAYMNQILTEPESYINDYIQLWYGKTAQLFVEVIKFLFTNSMKTFPKKLNNIKYSFNNYDFSKIKLVKFEDSIINHKIIKEIKDNQTLILTTFYYLNQVFDISIKTLLTKKINSHSFDFLKKFKNKENYLEKLTNDNIIIDKNGTISIKEIYNLINNTLNELELPTPIFTFNDVAEHIDRKYCNYIDINSISSLILRKKPLCSKDSEEDIWIDGKKMVKNGEIINIIENENDYSLIETTRDSDNIKGYVKNENITDYNNQKVIKIIITDSRANMNLNGISLKGYNRIKIFEEFCSENIIESCNSSIRLKELFSIFKKWYYDKDDYILYPTSSEIKEYFIERYSKYWNEEKGKYINIRFMDYDKYDSLIKFIHENINNETNKYIGIDQFYNTFKNWFREKYNDFIYPDKEDIKEYMDSLYNYKKYKGWENINFTKNNSNISIADSDDMNNNINNDLINTDYDILENEFNNYIMPGLK